MPTAKPPALPIGVEPRGDDTWVLVDAHGATLPEGEFNSEGEARTVASRINASWSNLSAEARKVLGVKETAVEEADGWHCAECKEWGWRQA
jgi:hypothetical protein